MANSALQAEGRRFEPVNPHNKKPVIPSGRFYFLLIPGKLLICRKNGSVKTSYQNNHIRILILPHGKNDSPY